MNELTGILIILGIGLLLLLALLLFAKRDAKSMPDDSMSSEERDKLYRQQIVSLYGKPIHHLYFTERPIYFYPDFMVVDGVKVPFKDFIGATFNNSATPYFSQASQVIIETANPEHKYIYAQIKSGDMDEARTVVMSIYRHVNKNNP